MSQLSHREAILPHCNTVRLPLLCVGPLHILHTYKDGYYMYNSRKINTGLKIQVCNKYCLVNYKYFYVKLVLRLVCSWSPFHFYIILYNKNMSISFVHSFTDWIFMSTYYMPSMILGTGNSEVNQKGKFSALMELTG